MRLSEKGQVPFYSALVFRLKKKERENKKKWNASCCAIGEDDLLNSARTFSFCRRTYTRARRLCVILSANVGRFVNLFTRHPEKFFTHLTRRINLRTRNVASLRLCSHRRFPSRGRNDY